jgi:hypothetical protein
MYDPEGRYGPCIELNLKALNDEYLGTTAKVWPRIQERRLDLVRKLRKDDVPDSAKAEILRKKAEKDRAYAFVERIDEPDKRTVSRLGGTYKVLVAICGGDRRKVEAILGRCDSFDELAEHFEGGSFVMATKVNDEGYPCLHLREDVYPDIEAQAAMQTQTNAEIDELPDDALSAEEESEMEKALG